MRRVGVAVRVEMRQVFDRGVDDEIDVGGCEGAKGDEKLGVGGSGAETPGDGDDDHRGRMRRVVVGMPVCGR